MRIKEISARQIIANNGHPTLQVRIATSKNEAYSSIPLAASKGKYEFRDSYDDKTKRFHHETLATAIDKVQRIISPEVVGKNCMDQVEMDQLLLDIDGTVDRSSLGVNVITAVSQAMAKLGAMESDLPLFKYIRILHDFTGVPDTRLNSEYSLPTPLITIYQAALHEHSSTLPFQELLLIPKEKFSYHKDLIKLFHDLSRLEIKPGHKTMKSFLNQATKHVKKLNPRFALGIDMAASRYKRTDDEGEYVIPGFTSPKVPFNGDEKKLARAYMKMVQEGTIRFIEDPFEEDDYAGWKEFKDDMFALDPSVQIVADDFTATNMERLDKISVLECANNVVLKPSQIGTISECISYTQRARKYGHNLTVSYRHGETEDTFIADLAVGINAKYIRTGPFQDSAYVAKLNRLLSIEESVY